jgi:tetratricopeptide (TPR) repeat protein
VYSRPEEPDDSETPFTTYSQALAWCAAELDNLLAATRQAAQAGEDTIAWQLPDALGGFFQLCKSFDVRITMCKIGLAAARRQGDHLGEAAMLAGLGIATYYLERFEECLGYYQQCVSIHHDLGEVPAMALVNLGSTYEALDRHDEALECLHQALSVARETRRHRAEGHALECLATSYTHLGRFDEAIDHAEQAVTVFRNCGGRYGEGLALSRLAQAYLALDRFTEAINLGEQAIAIQARVGDRLGEAWSLDAVAAALHKTGQLETTRRYWHRALAIFEEFGREGPTARIRELLSDTRTETTSQDPF